MDLPLSTSTCTEITSIQGIELPSISFVSVSLTALIQLLSLKVDVWSCMGHTIFINLVLVVKSKLHSPDFAKKRIGIPIHINYIAKVVKSQYLI